MRAAGLFTLLLAILQVADALRPIPWDGYRGIWYMNEKVGGEYVYKYSGGFATYPQWHAPVAIHAPAVQKTFFVLGGSRGVVSESGDRLVHLVGAFDHRTGEVSRPVRLLDKQTEDAHDNPVLSIDGAGHLWVFSAAHGTSRPAYIHRSRQPYDLSAWELVQTSNFSYPQPWYLPGRGEFLFLHTRYQQGQRSLFFARSRDGRDWGTPEKLAHIDMGDYQISWPIGDRVGTAFDMHPSTGRAGTGLNYRSNIYYLETPDAGRTWRTVDGQSVTLPVTHVAHVSRVLDTISQDRSVYLKDLAFDERGHPVILYLTSRGFRPGPESGPHLWFTARWTGEAWEHRRFTESDHNYDHGSITIEADGQWRVIAPTDPGPQPFGAGGEMVLWTSRDQGAAWSRARTLTQGSARNHGYARKPLGAHPGLYAIWADGDARQPSRSVVHIATRDGDVSALPERISAVSALPTRLVGPDR
jgi:BNR repeat-containing family member